MCGCANVRMCQCADPVKPGQVVRMLVVRLGVLPFTADPGHQNEDAVVRIPSSRDKLCRMLALTPHLRGRSFFITGCFLIYGDSIAEKAEDALRTPGTMISFSVHSALAPCSLHALLPLKGNLWQSKTKPHRNNRKSPVKKELS
jgi:hypothetical protein